VRDDSGRVQPTASGLTAPDFILTKKLRKRFASVQVHGSILPKLVAKAFAAAYEAT
jgi:hypothetical protein